MAEASHDRERRRESAGHVEGTTAFAFLAETEAADLDASDFIF